jgi:hypothetical protein
MPDEPKIPTYEEIERELGPDRMSFMSEMLRPDAEEEGSDEQVPATQTGLTPEEQKLISLLEWSQDRKFTLEQVRHALHQAREIGEL